MGSISKSEICYVVRVYLNVKECVRKYFITSKQTDFIA